MSFKRAPLKFGVGVLVVVALSAGLWGLGQWKPFAYKWPSKWDPRVAKLAGYVERRTKFRFEHAVKTRFLHDKEFDKLVTDDKSSLSKEDRDFYDATSLLLRTLGVAKGNVDLFKDQNTLNATSLRITRPKTARWSSGSARTMTEQGSPLHYVRRSFTS